MSEEGPDQYGIFQADANTNIRNKKTPICDILANNINM